MGAKVVSVEMSGAISKIRRLKTNSTLGTFASKEAERFMAPYVPVDTGVLRGSAGNSEPWSVTYNTPYAIYQYKGNYNHSKSRNPLAKSHWNEGIGLDEKVARSLESYIKGM